MLHKRSIKEKLLKGSVWAFSGKMLAALTGLAVNALLARLLSPAEMGAYFLILSLVSVVAIVGQLGLTQTIVRLVAESMGINSPSRARKSIVLVLRIAGISSVAVSFIFAYGLGHWVAEQLFNSKLISEVMGIASIWVFVIVFQQLLAEIYRGFHDIKLATLFGGLATSIISMILFLLLWLLNKEGNLEQIVTLTVVAGTSSVLISSTILWNKLIKLPETKVNVDWLKIIQISWPLS